MSVLPKKFYVKQNLRSTNNNVLSIRQQTLLQKQLASKKFIPAPAGIFYLTMTTDIVIITELKEKLKRAEYIRKQQLQLIQTLQTQMAELKAELDIAIDNQEMK